MKKLLLLALAAFVFSCSDSELFIEPQEDISVAYLEVEKPVSIDQVFTVVDEQPIYPGGIDAWHNHLLTNLTYPEKAKEKGVEGNVYLSFVVDKTGELRDFKVMRGIGAGCDEEALRVLMESEKWVPGKQQGEPVSARMQLRIAFKLSEGDKGPSSISVEEEEEIVEN
ncbi:MULTISPECIES: energy transducer TonB [Roseivirga]|jgi:protein TonB|uniref:TonB C-terminal domain-containing protein n=1 Tax=Roseivirga thermotolerans TaxID=1758176 RepID=A0ABQ3IAM8_9BACT|nr:MULTISPECIES: energy transducer TonB [Roseivirga]MEC7753511.1 energy transducer TonB [Bacteroidota bacterium]GHE70227.1 hypothetical protein GCM10011340_27360 [Roseivirga thermotolerans]|tara:strand:- start:30318 stop:30821 length:504 start_codon:yes stop_codon:yes gene_type:complete